MEELKLNIINLCNESGLPLEAIAFVLRDAYRDVEDTIRVYKASKENQKEEN